MWCGVVVCVYGCMAEWLYGCVGVCGRVAVCVPAAGHLVKSRDSHLAGAEKPSEVSSEGSTKRQISECYMNPVPRSLRT